MYSTVIVQEYYSKDRTAQYFTTEISVVTAPLPLFSQFRSYLLVYHNIIVTIDIENFRKFQYFDIGRILYLKIQYQ